MEFIKGIFENPTHKLLFGVGLFLLSVGIVSLLYRYIYNLLLRKAGKTKTTADDFILKLLRWPVLWLIIWILLQIFS